MYVLPHVYTDLHMCPTAYVYRPHTHTHTHLCPGAYVYIPHTYMQIYTRALEHMCTYHIPHTQGNKIYFFENVEALSPLPFLNSHT